MSRTIEEIEAECITVSEKWSDIGFAVEQGYADADELARFEVEFVNPLFEELAQAKKEARDE